ncbi:hypothetical protein KY309_01525 [Candidatus Woesearchaeota archaeon]|nr:hypothetical protein [Candidatus Woesearchaeota archaeon]MBW3016269.1 hypothetical protein [Candidatus Woesearchaeota archaeon]
MRATVEHRGKKRKARGYTAEEVFEAGLTCKQFEELRLQWDSRRKTKYKENIEQLKSLAKPEPKKK